MPSVVKFSLVRTGKLFCPRTPLISPWTSSVSCRKWIALTMYTNFQDVHHQYISADSLTRLTFERTNSILSRMLTFSRNLFTFPCAWYLNTRPISALFPGCSSVIPRNGLMPGWSSPSQFRASSCKGWDDLRSCSDWKNSIWYVHPINSSFSSSPLPSYSIEETSLQLAQTVPLIRLPPRSLDTHRQSRHRQMGQDSWTRPSWSGGTSVSCNLNDINQQASESIVYAKSHRPSCRLSSISSVSHLLFMPINASRNIAPSPEHIYRHLLPRPSVTCLWSASIYWKYWRQSQIIHSQTHWP